MKLNCCNLNDKILMVEEVFLTDEQRKWSFETESIPDEGAVKAVEMTAKECIKLQILI